MHLSSCCSAEIFKASSLFKLLNSVHNIYKPRVVSDRKIESCCKRRTVENTMAWRCVHVTAEAGKSHRRELMRGSIHAEAVRY